MSMNSNAQQEDVAVASAQEFVTAKIENQLFGIPVALVQDVLGAHALANIPMAPGAIAGALNLRGRIVTAIDVRRRLNLGKSDRKNSMSIVVDHHGELYSLLIDEVGEVLSITTAEFDRNPPTLEQHWRDVSLGIYRHEEQLMVVLDVERLLNEAHLG